MWHLQIPVAAIQQCLRHLTREVQLQLGPGTRTRPVPALNLAPAQTSSESVLTAGVDNDSDHLQVAATASGTGILPLAAPEGSQPDLTVSSVASGSNRNLTPAEVMLLASVAPDESEEKAFREFLKAGGDRNTLTEVRISLH